MPAGWQVLPQEGRRAEKRGWGGVVGGERARPAGRPPGAAAGAEPGGAAHQGLGWWKRHRWWCHHWRSPESPPIPRLTTLNPFPPLSDGVAGHAGRQKRGKEKKKKEKGETQNSAQLHPQLGGGGAPESFIFRSLQTFVFRACVMAPYVPQYTRALAKN